MLPRWAIKPEGHWSVGLDINHNHCVRCGRMIFIGGQVDLDADANQLNPGDLNAQAARSMAHVATLLDEAGAAMADLVKLTVFYVSDGSVDETDLLDRLAASMGETDGPGPAVTLVPLEALAFPGMEIEIDGIAMRDLNGPRLPRTAAWDPDGPRLPPPFVQALRCGEMLFTSGVTACDGEGTVGAPGSLTGQSRIVLPMIDRLLRQLGADLDDAVKTNVWNVEPGNAEDWRSPALARAGFYREPGPAATGISLPRLWPEGVMLRNDVIAMRGADGARMARSHVWPTGHWDWPV
ncbi:MAG: RidA family protein, partial [Hyphomicrobiales bacterium]